MHINPRNTTFVAFVTSGTPTTPSNWQFAKLYHMLKLALPSPRHKTNTCWLISSFINTARGLLCWFSSNTHTTQPTCPKTESTMGRSFLLSPSCSQRSSGSPTGDDKLRVLAFGLGGLFILAELQRRNDSIFFLMEPWREDENWQK